MRYCTVYVRVPIAINNLITGANYWFVIKFRYEIHAIAENLTQFFSRNLLTTHSRKLSCPQLSP
jgi:hypothetical protein